MEDQMTKRKLLELIKSERKKLEDCLAQISAEDRIIPGDENGWSVKDVMAHISAWEGKMRRWVEQIAAGDTPDRPPPGEPWPDLDQLNQHIYDENKGKSLAVVEAEFNNSYQETLRLVSSMPEADLIDPQRYEWTVNDPLYYLVGGNTFWHYEEHLISINNWKINREKI
jgi:hypothetical protein